MTDNEFSDLVFYDALTEMQPVVRYIATGNTNRNLIDQLVTKSKQPHILQFTPNDAARRFVDEQAYYTWLEQGHTVHWLLNDNNDLAGIIWYRTKPSPVPLPELTDITDTFAIRLYENYIGHRLSVPFMLLSLRILRNDLLKDNKPMPGIWLETTVGNDAAIKSYTRLGYSELFRDEEHVIMAMTSAELNHVIDGL